MKAARLVFRSAQVAGGMPPSCSSLSAHDHSSRPPCSCSSALMNRRSEPNKVGGSVSDSQLGGLRSSGSTHAGEPSMIKRQEATVSYSCLQHNAEPPRASSSLVLWLQLQMRMLHVLAHMVAVAVAVHVPGVTGLRAWLSWPQFAGRWMWRGVQDIPPLPPRRHLL